MDMEMGASKAKHWRESGLLPEPKPDSLTGSTHEDHVEWQVPEQWQDMTIEAVRQLRLSVKQEADEDAVENMRNIIDGVGNQSQGTTTVVIKAEYLTLEEELKQRATELIDNPTVTIRRLQDYELQCQVFSTKAANGKWAGVFVDECSRHIKSLQRLIKQLQKAVVEKPVADVDKVKIL